jgi:hypothetical protein
MKLHAGSKSPFPGAAVGYKAETAPAGGREFIDTTSPVRVAGDLTEMWFSR